MPPSTEHIRAVTEAYLARHPDERGSLAMLFAALAGAADPTSRKTFPAHVTCSAILINDERHVLHILHKASRKLLAPGGHNEPSDQHLRDAALRELHEEAGIPPSAVVPLMRPRGHPPRHRRARDRREPVEERAGFTTTWTSAGPSTSGPITR